MAKAPINVAINTITGDVLRWGRGEDIENNGSFDSDTETVMLDVSTDGTGVVFTNNLGNAIKTRFNGTIFENITNPDFAPE